MIPVVVFVYCRYEHTKRLFESLYKNKEAKDTIVYIFSDAAKKEKDVEAVDRVREFIHTVAEANKFREVRIVENTTNKGLASSIIDGVSHVLREYDSVIVLEDDLIVSSNFILYMNNALSFFQDNVNIGAISGFSYKLNAFKDYDKDIYVARTGNSWGWATWREIWNKVDWNVSDYDSFVKNRKKRRSFDSIQKNISNMLDMQMQGKIDSWAVRWDYHFWKNNLLTVYPVVSCVKNQGFGNGATHTKADATSWYCDSFGETDKYLMQNVKYRAKIGNELSNFGKKGIINLVWEKLHGLFS